MNESGSIDSSLPPSTYVEHVVRASGTSFYWAMRSLPPEKRQAMFAVYAFCRQVDDIADEPGEMEVEAAGPGRVAKGDRGSLRRHGWGPGNDGATGASRKILFQVRRISSPSSTAWKWMRPNASA